MKINKKTYKILAGIGLLTVCCVSIYAVVEVKNQDKEHLALFNRHTKVFSPEIPATAEFSGETVPMDLFYVREAFEREVMAATFMHSTTIMMFKRANRWFL